MPYKDPEKNKAAFKKYKQTNRKLLQQRLKVYNKTYPEKARAKVARWRAKNPEKRRAQSAVERAIRKGLLQRQPCEQCGNERSLAHHENYAEPLKVVWLCHRCHWDLHRSISSLDDNRQGQPATDLAHELSVAINKHRETLGGG